MKDNFIEMEKNVYDKGEKIDIRLKNDGTATYTPLSQYLKIYNDESNELVYDGESDIALPAIPKEQTARWDQEDLEGEKVPTGKYKVVFLEKYERKFFIE